MKCINICQRGSPNRNPQSLTTHLLKVSLRGDLTSASATNVVSLQFVRVPPPETPAQVGLNLKLMKNKFEGV